MLRELRLELGPAPRREDRRGSGRRRRASLRTVQTASAQTTLAPVSFSCSRFSEIVLHAARSLSTKVTLAAPRESASRPSAPEPAKRSSTLAPSTGPIRLNAASRTRSPVGRVASPLGAAIRLPRCVPAMILITLFATIAASMRRVTLLAIIAALGVPSSASAADFIALTVNPTRVAPGWTLSATVTNGSFSRGDEIVGLTLRRSFLNGRAEEQHALRAHPAPTTVSFDGRRGRWAARLGTAAAVNLAIETTGAPVPVEEAWGCRGVFVRIPVSLRGTLSLRTGTRFFKTILRTRLTGFVTTEAGTVDCSAPAASACEPSALASGGQARGLRARLVPTPRPAIQGARSRCSRGLGRVVPRDGGQRLRRPDRRPARRSRRRRRSAAASSSSGRRRRSPTPAPAGRRRRPDRRPGPCRRPSPAGEQRTLRLQAGVPATLRETR